jgi:hyperosmotically inducible protein
MKRSIFIALAIAAVGCDRSERARPEATGEQPAAPSAVENTKTNERDRNAAALTPGDQGGSEADRTITQHVRQGVVSHNGFSMKAMNVKIITIDGVVTLRGPVSTGQEKADIAGIAQGVGGVKRVDNQLEIAAN